MKEARKTEALGPSGGWGSDPPTVPGFSCLNMSEARADLLFIDLSTQE